MPAAEHHCRTTPQTVPAQKALHLENRRSDRRAPGLTESAICVQRLDDSLNSAIHTTYRSLLRSSSMHEPRGPPLEVVLFLMKSSRCKESGCNKKRTGAWGRIALATQKLPGYPNINRHPLAKEQGFGEPLLRRTVPKLSKHNHWAW